MRKKILRKLSLGLLTCLLLPACAGEEDAIQEPAPEEGGVKASEEDSFREAQDSWQDSHIPLKYYYEDVVLRDGVAYGYYFKESGIGIIAQNVQTGEVLNEVEIPGVTQVGNLTADSQGNIYLAGEDTFWKISGSGEIGVFEDFVLEDLEDDLSPTPRGIYVDAEGRFYLQYKMTLPMKVFYDDGEDNVYSMADRIYVKDSGLNTLFYEQIPDSRGSAMLAFSFSESGVPTVLAKSPEGIYISEIDVEAQRLAEKMQLDSLDFQESSRAAFTEGGFLFCKGNDLYRYEYDVRKEKKLLNLASCGVMADDILYLGAVGESIEIVDNYQGAEASEYVTIAEGEAQKTIITMGVMMTSNELEQIVAGYNRFSKEGKIELVPYYTGEDFEKALEQLKLDILRGSAPDILEISMINESRLLDKGILADLYGFMESDAEFEKEFLLEPFRKAYETDGHLYSCGAFFQIYSIWGSETFLQGKNGVSAEELERMLGSVGKTPGAVYGFSADEPVLTTLGTFALEECIDWEKQECNFTGEYMRGLLDFAAQCGGGCEGGVCRGIEEREILLSIGIISSVADYQIQDKLYGGVGFVGYPTMEGSGTAMGIRSEELAINAGGRHQDLAWDFVKYYMRNGYWGQGFPVLESVFDAAMQEAMQENIWDSAEGTYTAPKSVFTDGQMGYVEVYAASQKDVDKVKRLIESAQTRYKHNVEIMNIINEEAESYFSGQKDFEAVAEVIQSRVGLYLKE